MCFCFPLTAILMILIFSILILVITKEHVFDTKCSEYFQFISQLFLRIDHSRKCTYIKFLHIVFWDASNYRYSELGSVPIDSDNWDCTVRLYSCKITAIGIFVISYHYSVFFCPSKFIDSFGKIALCIMHLGVDGVVFYRAQFLENETGDEFCKSREIKNASALRRILYFLQHMHEYRVFLFPAKSEIQKVFLYILMRQKTEKINHSEGAENINFSY